MSSTLSGRCINHSFAHLQDSVGATEVTIATDGLACSTTCKNLCDRVWHGPRAHRVTSLNTGLWTVSLWGGLSVPAEGNLKAAACSYISDNVFLQLSFNSLCLALSCFHTTIVLQKKVSSIKTLTPTELWPQPTPWKAARHHHPPLLHLVSSYRDLQI